MTSKPVLSPKVKVFFDTNVLFTQDEAKLVSVDSERIIKNAANETGLEIEWVIPSVVISERRRQMLARGESLLIPMQRLERLMGHNLGITQDTLSLHIDKVITDTKSELKIVELTPDYKQISLEKLVESAVNRTAPFANDKTEKGFRDAIILETFLQLVMSSPKTPQNCRIVLVSADALLNEAAKIATNSANNVLIYSSLDELRTTLTAIGAQLTDKDLERIIPAAKKYFYDFDKKDGLYNKHNVYEDIKSYFELLKNSDPEFKTSLKKPYINETTFIEKKAQQTLKFRTSMSISLTATKQIFVKNENNALSSALLNEADQNIDSRVAPNASLLNMIAKQHGLLGNLQPEGVWKTVEKSGTGHFSIDWKATMSTASGKLIRGEKIAVVFDSVEWDDA